MYLQIRASQPSASKIYNRLPPRNVTFSICLSLYPTILPSIINLWTRVCVFISISASFLKLYFLSLLLYVIHDVITFYVYIHLYVHCLFTYWCVLTQPGSC